MKNKNKLKILILGLLISNPKIIIASTLNPLKVSSIQELIGGVLAGATYALTPIIVIMIIYAGFMFLKAQGDPGELGKAKTAFTNAVIGAAIILAANIIFAVVYSTVESLKG